MGVKSFTKGVKDSYKTHLAPAVSSFRQDVNERAKQAKIEALEEQLAKAKQGPQTEDDDEQETASVSTLATQE